MRNAFFAELLTAAAANPRIALIVGDLGFSVVEPFIERFPRQFINAGVAEQNMMGLAAGMASEGYHVFVYSIANFPTFRCAEQIRNDVDYHRLPVTVVAVGGGLAYGSMGYSHHAVQDYALLRCLPNMLLAAPGDPMEVRACMRYLLQNPQPSYLRLGKAGERCIHAEVPGVAPGEWLPVRVAADAANVCLSTGAAMDTVARLTSPGAAMADWSHYSMPLWGMACKNRQPENLQRFQTVMTVEDHLLDGGFGSWLLESAANRADLLPRIRNRALAAGVCGQVGSQATLNAAGGLSAENLCA